MNLMPDEIIDSVRDISTKWMNERGLLGLALDLDNTLARYHKTEASPEVVAWLKEMQSNGFRLMLCSNSKERRVMQFCEPLGLKYVHTARKPMKKGVLTAVTAMGLLPDQVAMVGDQVFTDVLSGKRATLYTVLVNPIDNSGVFRVRRRIEELLVLNRGRRKF